MTLFLPELRNAEKMLRTCMKLQPTKLLRKKQWILPKNLKEKKASKLSEKEKIVMSLVMILMMKWNQSPKNQKREDELEMKRFRYDVIKFGMSGMEQKQARHAKIALAISLGAKPTEK